MGRRSPFFAFGLPAVAVFALVSAIISMANSNRTYVRQGPKDNSGMQPVTAILPEELQSSAFIGATAIVEPSSQTFRIRTEVAGLVEQVFVKTGSKVKQGDPLFELDSRVQKAILAQRRTELAVATARLQDTIAKAPGVAADHEAARSAVHAAQAQTDDTRWMLESARKLKTGFAITRRELIRRENALRTSEAQLEGASARLRKADADLVRFDEARRGTAIAMKRAAVALAKAALEVAEIDVVRRTIYSPIDATVLQVDIRPGEYAHSQWESGALMMLGQLAPLHVRVDINEEDIPRWRRDGLASASVRGSAHQKLALSYVRKEPLVIPKKSLSGRSEERLDTRVMQVIYAIENAEAQILPGQQLDVFIDLSRLDYNMSLNR